MFSYNKLLVLFLLLIFLINPSFANIYLTKDEEILYTVKADDGVFFNDNLKKYQYLIKKYTIHNDTNYDYCITDETELYNEDDYKTLLSLKTKSFEVSEDTFLFTMCSVFFPPLLVAAIPSLLVDAAKTPVKALKNKKTKKQKENYKQTLKGIIVKAKTESIFFTLQNTQVAAIPFSLSLENKTTAENIKLNEPEKALHYSKKYENTRSLDSNKNNTQSSNEFIKNYSSDNLDIFALESPLYMTVFENSVIKITEDTVFSVGGKQKQYYIKNPNSNITITNSNLDFPFFYNVSKPVWYKTKEKLSVQRINPVVLLFNKNKILVAGGNNQVKNIDIFNNIFHDKTPVKGPELQVDISNNDGFAFENKDGNVIIGKTFNSFIEKYNPKTNKIEKINIAKIDGIKAGESTDKVYFASEKTLSYLDKNTLEYKVFAVNKNYSNNSIISAYFAVNNEFYIAKKMFNDIVIYKFNKDDSEEKIIVKLPGQFVQFFKFPYSNNIYLLNGNYNSNAFLYVIENKTQKAKFITKTNFFITAGKFPIVSMSDGTLVLVGAGTNFVYSFVERQKFNN